MRIGLAIVASNAGPAMIVALAASAAAAPRPGRVVRVEHALRGPLVVPRFCVVPTLDDARAFCFGPEPQTGDAIDLIDQKRYLGRWRITRADSTGTCRGSANLWQVDGEPDGDVAAGVTGQIAGVIGMPVDERRAHMMTLDEPPPDLGTAQMEIGFGVDADGDDHADVEFVVSKCDELGPGARCFDVWSNDGQALRLVDRQVFAEGCF